MGSSIRKPRILALAVLGALSAAGVRVEAQRRGGVALGSATPELVSGRVSSPGRTADLPIGGAMVTLHRVGTDSSGPVDSVRTDAGGRYTLRYRRFGASDAVYFAAAVHRGIAYFSAPLRSGRAVGEEAEITVFDTTTHAVEFHVRGHHFVVSGPRPDGARNIVEVWELSNDTTVTVLGRDSLTPVWSATLPRGAVEFAGGQGDVSASAVVARGNRVVLLAPFGPGVKQISYSYSLPSASFPLDLPLERPTVVLEVLVEEPGAQVSGAALRSMAAATTSGRTFKRFLTQDAPTGSTIHITVPIVAESARSIVLIGLASAMAVIMMGALVRAIVGPRRVGQARATGSEQQVEALMAEIAQLDVRRERGDVSLDDATYTSSRATLKTRLAAALAGAQHSA